MTRTRGAKRILLGLLLVLMLAGVGVVSVAYYGVYKPAIAFGATVTRAGKVIAPHEKEFLSDQAYAASLPFFASRKGTRDAGPLIGPRIHWTIAKPGAVNDAALSDAVIDRDVFDKIGKNWLSAPPELWRGLDFGWMAQLAQCDYWDIEKNSVSDRSDLMGPDPVPGDLFAWAKLRLAKGVHENALPSAVAEVEDLARLCFTAERHSLGLYGIGLLADARRAREKGGLPHPELDLGRIQRALGGALAFARLETPPEFAGNFDHLMVGRCAALQYGAWAAIIIRAELRGARAEEYRRLDHLLRRTPECRLERIRGRWALPDEPLNPNDAGSDWWDRLLWRWSPAWRRAKAETLVGIGSQDWFKGYDRNRSNN
jgi:hypothetical protein